MCHHRLEECNNCRSFSFLAVKQIFFCSWQEDEYPYVGQKCSAESAGVLQGKSQCSLTVLKGCKMLYD